MKLNFSKFSREPLVHFLILGGLLFLLFHVINGSGGGNREKLVISSGVIRSLAENFQRVWQREPTKQELDGLVQEYIKEEIFYREALSLKLDRDDPVVRRRLRQKMEFLAEGMSSSIEPSDKDLQQYLSAHPEKFRVESRYTFSHVFLNPERHDKNMKQDTEQILKRLRTVGTAVDVEQYGDPFLLGYNFSNTPESNVTRTFGDEFARQLKQLPEGQWTGPVPSAYGEHLVFLSDRTEGHLPHLSEIRSEVQREWMNVQQKKLAEQYYEKLRDRYTILIEEPIQKQKSGAEAGQ